MIAINKTDKIVEKCLFKGKEIKIKVKLTSRFYETENGEKKYVTEILVNAN